MLQGATWSPLRLTYSTENLETIPTEFLYTREYIIKLMDQAVTFFKDTLLVLPNPSPSLVINTTSCGDLNLPDYLRT
jgi:hypothetical protein